MLVRGEGRAEEGRYNVHLLNRHILVGSCDGLRDACMFSQLAEFQFVVATELARRYNVIRFDSNALAHSQGAEQWLYIADLQLTKPAKQNTIR